MRCHTRGEDSKESYHQGQQQYSDQEQLALRVAEIHGPPQTEAFWDKHCRIVGIVVKDASIPVPIIIAENGVSTPAISECARLCLGTLRVPEQGKDEDNQQSTHQQEQEPHVHKIDAPPIVVVGERQ
jgi:hypothetical protein